MRWAKGRWSAAWGNGKRSDEIQLNAGELMNTAKLKAFTRRHWFPVTGFVLSASFALWFGFTFMAEAIYFNDPRHQNVELERWMTPHFIALSYDLPHPVVLEALGLDPKDERRRQRVGRIAARQGLTLEELTAHVRQVAEAHRESGQ